jgi:hypothetical protein
MYQDKKEHNAAEEQTDSLLCTRISAASLNAWVQKYRAVQPPIQKSKPSTCEQRACPN